MQLTDILAQMGGLQSVARELAKGRNALADMKIEAVLDDAPAPALPAVDLIDV